MEDAKNDRKADDEKQLSARAAEAELEAKYKAVGITAVLAAANYVNLSKPRRAA